MQRPSLDIALQNNLKNKTKNTKIENQNFNKVFVPHIIAIPYFLLRI